ncbi:MAG: cation:proton antiporter, partial [Opitutaceae bacterium]
MKRTAVFYLVTLVIAGVGIVALLHVGGRLPQPEAVSGAAMEQELAPSLPEQSVADAFTSGLWQNFSHPLGRLFMQLLVIITASRLLGAVFSRCGQPAVVGEMIAGVLLGPSVFGWLAPAGFQLVFPAEAVGVLDLLSQIGVCLFMFAVGMELDVRHVRSRAQAAVLVSHASIVIPFFLGVGLACFLYSELAQPGATFTAFALFIAIAMSITAFPVLARMLQERRLSQTPMGVMAITCAAVDDVTAWSLLAVVVAIVRATSVAAATLNLFLVLGFMAIMIWGVRRALPPLIGERRLEGVEPSRGVLAFVVCVVIGAALCAEVIGVHALFGAFLAGAIMPEAGNFRQKLGVRIENFSSVLL